MTRQYKLRTYEVGEQLLELRNRTGLTQTELAQLSGVSKRSILKWEGGEGIPNGTHLHHLFAVFAAHGAFTIGQECAEAEALWEQVRQAGTRRQGLFNVSWFEHLLTDRDARRAGDSTQPIATALDLAADEQLTNDGRDVVIGLPFQPALFLGRGKEITEIAHRLADPACRLLTLLGPGGIGKTRLALAVAAAQTAAFADGVAFIELASISTPNQIVSAIGDTIGLSFAGQPDPTAHLFAFLRERRMLLILDNFEHLLEGADLVNDILKRAPHVTLLITSRERLNLQAEWLFDVDGLTYPPQDDQGLARPQHLANLAEYSAVELFVQRATQVQPRFSLTESTLTTIMRICRQVAGMPLAIELAAASVRMLPLSEVERQLSGNLDGLTTTLRDVAPRHRSMRAVFDHSWQLLSEGERALFSDLAVFRGGWTLAAAEQVAGATLPTLTLLVDKSLVRAGSAEGAAFGALAERSSALEPRYTMLEPLREYALEQLAVRGEADVLQRVHAAYYLALAEAMVGQWDSPVADTAMGQLDREHDNLRAALQWARDSGERTLGLQLAGALWKFWRRRGYLGEGRRWLAELLTLDAGVVVALPEAAQATAAKATTWLASDEHDFAQVVALFQESIAQRRTLGQTIGLADVLINGARQARDEGNYAQAVVLLEESLVQHRDLIAHGRMDRCELGPVLQERAMVAREQGDFARAKVLWEECLDLYRSSGDWESIAVALLGLGDIARDQGDAAQVRVLCAESLAIFRDVQQPWGIGYSLNNLALAAHLGGDLELAATLAEEGIALFCSLQASLSLAEVFVTLGRVWAAQGKVGKAQEVLLEALRLAWAEGPRWLLAATVEALGALTAELGQAEQATRLLGAAAALRERMGAPARPADRPAIAHARATAQAVLGASGFARVWAEAGERAIEQILGTIPSATAFAARGDRSRS